MLEIAKTINDDGYHAFDIITDDGIFEISYEANLDLYWRYVYDGSIEEVGDTKEFKITKENFYLYSLFEELYSAVKDKLIKDNNRQMEYYGNHKPYKNKMIIWYSDDFVKLANASSFSIKKYKEYFLVTFTKSKTPVFKNESFPTYTIRIRNSGSRYAPYNVAFMDMYQRLKEDVTNYHQIHIEEYLYSKKRVLKK